MESIVGIAPDVTTNPFLEIMLMTSTHSNPKENFTVEQAVMAYTKINAYAELKEKTKETLAKGKVADFAVLSQDIFPIPAQQTTSCYTKCAYYRRRNNCLPTPR